MHGEKKLFGKLGIAASEAQALCDRDWSDEKYFVTQIPKRLMSKSLLMRRGGVHRQGLWQGG